VNDDALSPSQHGRSRVYRDALAAILKSLIPPNSSVLQIGCGNGDLLHSVRPSRGVGLDKDANALRAAQGKYPDLDFVLGEAEHIPLGETFDYVVLADVVGDLSDVWRCFRQLRSLTRSDSRVIVTYYNFLWRPVILAAERLGLKPKQPESNWLSPADIGNLLRLNGFESVMHSERVLLPLSVPGVTKLCNDYVALLPWVRKLCLVNYLVARPVPQALLPDTSKLTCSVIIPTRNEAGNIAAAVARTPKMGAGTELIFVDGHSVDGTVEKIESEMASYRGPNLIRLIHQVPRGSDASDAGTMLPSGKAQAVRLGFDAATGDVLMILDGDLTVLPEELPMFFAALTEGHGEFVNGTRLVYPLERDSMRTLNMIANKAFGVLFSWTLGQRITDTLCGTKVLFRQDQAKIMSHGEGMGMTDPFGDFDLLFGAAIENRRIVEVPVHYQARTYGDIKIERWKHGLLLARMSLVALRRFKLMGLTQRW